MLNFIDIAILKEFLLPMILAVFATWQQVKIAKITQIKKAAEGERDDLKSRSEVQNTIMEMVERMEKDYAELLEKYLNLRKIFLDEKEKDNGRAAFRKDSGDEYKD